MTRSSVCVGAQDIIRKSFVCRDLFGSLDRIQLKLDFECSWNRLVDQCCHRWNFDFRFHCPIPGGNFGWRPAGRDPDLEAQESLEEVERKEDSAGKVVQRISPVHRLEVSQDRLERLGVEASTDVQRRTSATKEDCDRLTATESTSGSDERTTNGNTRLVETTPSITSLPGLGILPLFLLILHSGPQGLPHSLSQSVSPLSSLSPTNSPSFPSSSSRPFPDSPSAFIPADPRASRPERKRKSPGKGRSNTFFLLQAIRTVLNPFTNGSIV